MHPSGKNSLKSGTYSDLEMVTVDAASSSQCRSMHEQLVHESPEENFSEKRVNLLKSQILQLERQVRLYAISTDRGVARNLEKRVEGAAVLFNIARIRKRVLYPQFCACL